MLNYHFTPFSVVARKTETIIYVVHLVKQASSTFKIQLHLYTSSMCLDLKPELALNKFTRKINNEQQKVSSGWKYYSVLLKIDSRKLISSKVIAIVLLINKQTN